MASSLVLNLLITATDAASDAFGKLFRFIDSTASSTANAIRGVLSGAFGGAVNDAIQLEAALSRVQSKSGDTAEEMFQSAPANKGGRNFYYSRSKKPGTFKVPGLMPVIHDPASLPPVNGYPER